MSRVGWSFRAQSRLLHVSGAGRRGLRSGMPGRGPQLEGRPVKMVQEQKAAASEKLAAKYDKCEGKWCKQKKLIWHAMNAPPFQ